MIRGLSRTALLAVCLFSAGEAAAQTILTSATDPKLTGAQLLDFETATAGTAATLTFTGVTFTADVSYAASTPLLRISSDYASQYNTQGQSIDNNEGDASKITITFTNFVSAFGFAFGASDSNWTLTAYDSSNNAIASTVISPVFGSNAGDFFGIASTSANIAKAVLVVNGGTPVYDHVFIDNFKFTAVPEPSTWVLLGLGAVGLLAWHRRRR